MRLSAATATRMSPPATAAPTATPGGGKPADATSVIEASHPHLKRAMSPDQVEMWREIAKNTSYKTFSEQVPDGDKLIGMALEIE